MTVKVTLRIEQKESGGDETFTAESRTTWVTPVVLRVMHAALGAHSSEFHALRQATQLIADALNAASAPGGTDVAGQQQ